MKISEKGHKIVQLTEPVANARLNELSSLLQDAVDSGASLGFLPPLTEEEARQYWQDCLLELQQGKRLIFIMEQGTKLVGTVQLALAQKSNALHRAEVQKLCVHRQARSQGLGRALLTAVEETARLAGRTLLVLDTKEGDIAEHLYGKMGYIRLGVIPNYTRDADGTSYGTVLFYKTLKVLW